VPTEIERKFLVRTADWKSLAVGKSSITQGYLSADANATVRIRIRDDDAFLTIKSGRSAMSRLEFEYAIPREDAEEMLRGIASKPCIRKTRHIVIHRSQRWEVDVFEDDNAGLVVAEIELAAEDETVFVPDWVSKEVTGEARYYNSSLISNPYKTWAV
jgi:adenylate cyclase